MATILDELYIHVGEAHQYYNYFLKGGYLDGRKKYYTCRHWRPGIDYMDFEISNGPFELWLLVCQDCVLFDWESMEKSI